MKVTIVGGGNIGSAIALGMAKGGIIPASNITVCDKFEESLNRIKAKNSEINGTTSNEEGVKDADLVILAVKPWLAEDILKELSEYLDLSKQMFASIVAGLSIENIKRLVSKDDDEEEVVGSAKIDPVVFRIMANIAISQQASVNSISGSLNATKEQIEIIKTLFGTLGLVFYIPENLQVSATSLTSCGIAFALKFLSDSILGGEMIGFNKEDSRAMVLQTMRGALAVLEANQSMPEDEIRIVTTPNGVTLRGLEAMSKENFTNAVVAGITRSK